MDWKFKHKLKKEENFSQLKYEHYYGWDNISKQLKSRLGNYNIIDNLDLIPYDSPKLNNPFVGFVHLCTLTDPFYIIKVENTIKKINTMNCKCVFVFSSHIKNYLIKKLLPHIEIRVIEHPFYPNTKNINNKFNIDKVIQIGFFNKKILTIYLIDTKLPRICFSSNLNYYKRLLDSHIENNNICVDKSNV